MSMRNVGLVCLGVLVALCAALPAPAQFGVYGQVKGKVLDVDGKPIVGAEVVFVNPDSGRTFKMKTDKHGEYFSQGLDQGDRYEITVYKDGKQLVKREKARVFVGQYGDVNNTDFKNTFDFDLSRLPGQKAKSQEAVAAEQAKAGYDRAVILNREGKFEEALAELQPLLEKDPAQAAVHGQMAVAYKGLNRLDEAVASLQKAIELDPANASYHSVLGEIYLKQKKTDEARKEFETAANLSPEDAALYWYNLAVTFYNAGDAKSAIEPLRKVIELDPGHANAHFYLGVCLYSTAPSRVEGGEVKLDLLPGTKEEFETYLSLAPEGPLAEQAKAFLQQMGATVPAAVRTRKK